MVSPPALFLILTTRESSPNTDCPASTPDAAGSKGWGQFACSPLGTQIIGTHTTRASSDVQPRGGAGPALPHTAASKGQDQFWVALSLRFSAIGVTDSNTDCAAVGLDMGHHHEPGDLHQPAPHHCCLFRSGSLHKTRTILPLFISYTAPYICSPQWYLTV